MPRDEVADTPIDEVADTPRDELADEEAFLDYHMILRVSDADRPEFENEWNHKTDGEREQIAEAVHSVTRADEEYGRANDPIEGQLGYIRNAMNNPVRDLGYLPFVIAEVLERLKEVNQAAAALGLAWRKLSLIEHEQRTSTHPRNNDRAWDRARHWDQVVEYYDEEILAFGRFVDEKQPVPLNGKSEERVPEDWLGRIVDDDEDRAKASIRGDRMNDRIGFDERRPNVTWQAWRDCSGMSDGMLWLCFDDTTGLVVDRVFRKDVYFKEKSMWYHPRWFDGDVRNADLKTPWEISCHSAMQAVERFDNVVRLRNGDNRDFIDHDAKTFRLYVEWCPNGDLSSILDKYTAHQETLPEPLLWSVFECLADCAKAMEDGDIDPLSRAADWNGIVHQDIKPHNVLLGHPDPKRYPQYPRPMIADFGLAFKTWSEDASNPELWAGGGTGGWLAPEQVPYFDRVTGVVTDKTPLSGATNIYGIGAILARLMTRPAGVAQPIWLADGSPENTLYSLQVPEDDNGSELDQYSRELKALVNRCLSFRPEDRPAAQELRWVIDDAIHESRQPRGDGTPWPNLAKGMRSGEAAKGAGRKARKHAVFLDPDPYQLHFARHQLERRNLD